jgi:hypothetical protein
MALEGSVMVFTKTIHDSHVRQESIVLGAHVLLQLFLTGLDFSFLICKMEVAVIEATSQGLCR